MEDRREGELLRQQALQEADETRAKEAARMARARRMNAETMEVNKTLKAFKLQVRQARGQVTGQLRGRQGADSGAQSGPQSSTTPGAVGQPDKVAPGLQEAYCTISCRIAHILVIDQRYKSIGAVP